MLKPFCRFRKIGLNTEAYSFALGFPETNVNEMLEQGGNIDEWLQQKFETSVSVTSCARAAVPPGCAATNDCLKILERCDAAQRAQRSPPVAQQQTIV
jgi:hypothetical protein